MIEMKGLIENEAAWYLQELSESGLSKNTVMSYRADLNHLLLFCRTFHLYRVEELDSRTLSQFFTWMQKDGRSNATIRRLFSGLMGFFRAERRAGKIGTNPMQDLSLEEVLQNQQIEVDRKAEPEKQTITAEQVTRLLAAQDGERLILKRNRALLMLLVYTGVRTSELIELKVKDVDLITGNLCAGSGEKRREIPLGFNTLRAVRIYLDDLQRIRHLPKEMAQESLLFPGRTGKALTRQGLWKIVHECVEEAGLPDTITPESLRKSLMEHLLEEGAPKEHVAELMGTAPGRKEKDHRQDTSEATSYFAGA